MIYKRNYIVIKNISFYEMHVRITMACLYDICLVYASAITEGWLVEVAICKHKQNTKGLDVLCIALCDVIAVYRTIDSSKIIHQ